MTIWFSALFIIIPLLFSARQKLALEKEIAVSALRCAIQLFLIGYVLQYIFASNHPVLIALLLLMMLLVATWNAARRGAGIPGIHWRIASAMIFSELVTMSLLIGTGSIKLTPQYLVPLSGMILGNAMVVSGLFLSQLKREVNSSRGEIETLLSLGATRRQAIQPVIKRVIKASMIPTFDTMKTMGLVQLPGTMTGMIIAGASPVDAVKYQIMIMFSLAAAATLSAMVLALLCYSLWYTPEGYLREQEQ
nr:iron export ABC transporter permease subunit FetB [Brevibacillus fulvus]